MSWNPLQKIIGFDKILNIRITSQEYDLIVKVVKKNNENFYNVSHFVRSSILKNLREYDKKGKLLKWMLLLKTIYVMLTGFFVRIQLILLFFLV